MSRLFLGEKERAFANSIAKELIQEVVEQKVIYYAVSEEHTKTHRVYDEAISKTVFQPVEINALVLYDTPEQTVGQYSMDTVYRTELYFHTHELKERDIQPRQGDFIKFGNIIYEIEHLTRDQIFYGQIEEEVMLKATCRVARKSQMEIFDDIKGY